MSVLSRKVAIAPGASKGIAAEIFKTLVEHGAKAVVKYADGKIAAENVVKEIIQNGFQAIRFQADISNPKNIKNLFDTIIAHFSKVDIFVNNKEL